MNKITVITRDWLNEFRNGPAFLSNPTVSSNYPKFEGLERVQLTTVFSISTYVQASPANEFLFTDLGASATLTMSLPNWATEGFKVGDSVRLVYGALTIDETVEALAGNVITISDSGIVATLGIVSGTYYDDLELRNITIPTSVQFKFGIVPNVADPYAPSLVTSSSPFGSWIDGQIQSYSGDGMAIATPVTLTGSMTSNAEITESVTVEYGGETDDYIFEFTQIHVFRVPAYKTAYLTNFINNTTPSGFTVPDSYRYIAWYKFGTSSTDPNEWRVFNDNLLNGSYGWINNNFTSGTGIYEFESITIEDPDANVLSALEATVVNTVQIRINRTTGNFTAGDKAILYVMKLPSDSEYAGVTTDWETNHIFDSVTNTDGSAPVDGDFIKQLVVDIPVDTTKIDITFDVDYSTAQKALIEAGDRYFIGVQVGDDSLTADVSDRKIVWCQVEQYTKDSDITGLIANNVFNCYTSEKRPGFGAKPTNVDTWDNRLHHAVVEFTLTKFADSDDCNIRKMYGQVVSRNSVTGESFVIDNFRIPFNYTNVVVDGTTYQTTNYTGYRDFNIKSDAYANTFNVVASLPGSFDATQSWSINWPFVIPWREWIFNPNVPTTFYDNGEPNNKLNYKTSNYSDNGDWDIYIRLLVTVRYNGVDTDYGIYSTECHVRDFDVDPDTYNWTAETKLYDQNDNEIDYILEDHDTRVETTFSMATAGGITYSRLVGEFSIEEYQSTGQNCRLNSNVDWWYNQNILKPLDGESYVKITQDVPGNTIKIECLIDHELIDSAKSYTIMSHLQDTT